MNGEAPTGQPRSGLALAGLALLFAACRSGPLQRVRSTYESTRSGPNEVRTQTNLVELAVQDRVGPDLEYRLNERFVQSTQDITTATDSFEDQSILNRPSVDLVVTSGALRWTQLFQVQQDRTLSGSGPDNELVRTDLLQKLEWTPADLPQVTAWVDFRSVEDDFFVSQDRIESRVEVQQALDPFSYEYSYRNERTDDIDVDVQRDRSEHIGRLTYEERFLEDRLSTTTSLFASERNNTTEFSAGTAPSIQVFPTLGFAAIDTTPQVSTLPTNPALIDGNLLTSAGVNIGGFASGGEISWNLGVQLEPGSTVDVVHLQTVDPVGSTFVGGFSFSVWASEDNTFWTLVKSSAAYVYDPAFQRFQLSIPSVSSRFLKIVNTASPAAAPAVLVSEIEVFRGASDLGTNSIANDDAVRSATTNLAWRAADSLTLGADLLLQKSLSDTDGTDTRDENRLDAGVWASWSPAAEFQTNVRASSQRIDDRLLRDETLTTLQGVFSYRPLQTLDVDLSLVQTDRDVDGEDDVQTDVAQALASAELLPTLRAELSIERNVTDDAGNEREVSRWIYGAALIAELTPHVDVTLRARNDDATVSGAGASLIPNPSEDRYEFTWVYRPSEQLIAEAELEWIDTYAGSGLDQRLRLDWIPFSDGAVDTQLDFDRTRTESFGDTQIDRYRALVRYDLGPFTYLEFQYAAEFPDQGDSVEIVTVSFAFDS